MDIGKRKKEMDCDPEMQGRRRANYIDLDEIIHITHNQAHTQDFEGWCGILKKWTFLTAVFNRHCQLN